MWFFHEIVGGFLAGILKKAHMLIRKRERSDQALRGADRNADVRK